MAFLKLGVAASLFALAGCAVEADEPALLGADDDADAASKRPAYGVVTVERTEGEGVSRASVSAKFMRVAPADRALAEDLVSARAVVPPGGECASLSSLEGLSVARLATALEGTGRISDLGEGAALPQGFTVELLDVGDVSFALHNTSHNPAEPALLVPLSPRAFPDVGDLASGVFYTTPDATLPLPEQAAGGAYELLGSGATLVDAFLLDVGAMPEHPTNILVDGVLVDGAAALGSTPPTVDGARELTLGWRGGQADLVYVDILGSSAFRCSFADDGSAVLPPGILSDQDRGAEVTVAIHRVTERLVQLKRSADADAPADELEGAEARVRFDLASAVRVLVK